MDQYRNKLPLAGRSLSRAAEQCNLYTTICNNNKKTKKKKKPATFFLPKKKKLFKFSPLRTWLMEKKKKKTRSLRVSRKERKGNQWKRKTECAFCVEKLRRKERERDQRRSVKAAILFYFFEFCYFSCSFITLFKIKYRLLLNGEIWERKKWHILFLNFLKRTNISFDLGCVSPHIAWRARVGGVRVFVSFYSILCKQSWFSSWSREFFYVPWFVCSRSGKWY